MTAKTRLTVIKLIHTGIWLFFNGVIFYLLYAVIWGKIDAWVWICIGLIGLETLTLLVFRWICPLTLLARRYSTSRQENFDIYLPNWLVRYNKEIYSVLVLVSLLMLGYRFIQAHVY